MPKKVQIHTTTFLWIIMMLMCGFRAYDVGVDTHNYVAYQEAPYADYYSWGPLYIVLKQIADFFPNEPTAFLFLMSLLTYLPLMVITRKESINQALTLLMYIIPCGIFFNESFNIARQSIAIIYILLAGIEIENNRLKRSYILTFIAFLFHPYVIFFIFFYLIRNVRFTQQFVNVTIIVSMMLGLVGTISGIQAILSAMFAMFSGSEIDLLLKLAKYGDGYDIISGFSVIGQLSHMLPMAVLCVLGCNKYMENNTYYKMMVCGSAITNVLVSVIFCERFASTFTIAQLLAVPLLLKTSSKKRKILIYCVLLLTIFLYIYNLQEYSSDPDLWTPYHTVFS